MVQKIYQASPDINFFLIERFLTPLKKRNDFCQKTLITYLVKNNEKRLFFSVFDFLSPFFSKTSYFLKMLNQPYFFST